MPQPRTPTAILDAKGSFILHPERSRENEPDTSDKKPLGNPPKHLSDDHKKVWRELRRQMLPGVCFESDRTAFELLVRLVFKMQNDTINRSEVSSLIALTGRFAMNPADRSKVSVEKPKESKLDKFLRRPSAPSAPVPQPTTETVN
jgi:phage terminase small subunit